MSAGHGMNQKELEAFQKKFGFGEQKIIELRHAFEAVDKVTSSHNLACLHSDACCQDSSGAISVEEIAEVYQSMFFSLHHTSHLRICSHSLAYSLAC